ncbi:zinc finger protein 726-like isoform X2 [Ruditapes philippinarum]|uniref:zinc finger protein 726-like isoform X2 n=1 Tax=Ruditapes philippinarum TaxID=129788 RepID=UPI00295C28DA|nr:zinc finger protein 726-like isoform X2 [Ruditapes philippinarum]
MDSYMLILYVTLNQEEAIRKLFYEEGWKYIKEDGDLTIVRSDELHGTISAGVNDDNSADVSTFHFDVSCPEENESGILKSTIETCGDQNRNCSVENRDNDIVYNCNNFKTQCQSNNIENGTQHKKSFTEIKVNRTVNGNDCHYDNVQADFVDNGKQTRCNENDMKEYYVKDIQGQNFEQGSAEDGLTTNKQDSDWDYLSDNGQDDDDVSKLKTKTGHDSHSIGTDESSVDKLKHLISRGKLLSIENRKRLKQERKALRPAKKRKKLDTYKCKISSKKKPTFCSDCKVTFTSQNRYDKHKERNGGQCVFPCQYCDKVFLYRKSRYDLHVRSAHSKERPFKCDVCQKGYITSDKLKIHKRVHTGEKPCVCEECLYIF